MGVKKALKLSVMINIVYLYHLPSEHKFGGGGLIYLFSEVELSLEISISVFSIIPITGTTNTNHPK